MGSSLAGSSTASRSLTVVLPAIASAMRKEALLTREQLYQEVWAAAVNKVAARFGLSGNGLAKICRRLEVPVPDRGYWALKAVGRAPARPPLPPPAPSTPPAHRLVERTLPSAALSKPGISSAERIG